MEYLRAHGTGNDFVVLVDPADTTDVSAVFARALCDRRTGVGGDGVIRIGAPPPDQARAAVFMDHRNADGSLAEMCGNGVRVVAKLAVDLGLVDRDVDEIAVATRAGIRDVRIATRHPDGSVASVTVDMGAPILDARRVPFHTEDPLADVHVLATDDLVAGQLDDAAGVEISVASMGNPHGVLVVEDPRRAPVAVVGPWLERHPRFPDGANIGFAAIRDRVNLELRVWERGVGETSACGTGACAAVVVLQRRGLLDVEVAVHLPGGMLIIHHEPGGTVSMTGTATTIATGTLDREWERRAAADTSSATDIDHREDVAL